MSRTPGSGSGYQTPVQRQADGSARARRSVPTVGRRGVQSSASGAARVSSVPASASASRSIAFDTSAWEKALEREVAKDFTVTEADDFLLDAVLEDLKGLLQEIEDTDWKFE